MSESSEGAGREAACIHDGKYARRSARTAAECSEQMQNLFLTSDECYVHKAVVLLRAVIHVMNE